jgi:hypothetical protein
MDTMPLIGLAEIAEQQYALLQMMKYFEQYKHKKRNKPRACVRDLIKFMRKYPLRFISHEHLGFEYHVRDWRKHTPMRWRRLEIERGFRTIGLICVNPSSNTKRMWIVDGL